MATHLACNDYILTFIIAFTEVNNFYYCEFRPPNSVDIIVKLQRAYVTFAQLTPQEQLGLAALYTRWRPWLDRMDGFAEKFIEGLVEKDVAKQRGAVVDLGDHMEELLRSVFVKLASALWGDNSQQELIQRIGKGKPPERLTLGELVEGGALITKMSVDKGLVVPLPPDQLSMLRKFVELRNESVHWASRTPSARQASQQNAREILTLVFPTYYALEDSVAHNS